MILFTASNFTFSQTKPIFNLILCIMLGIFSLSLFVLAFVIGRKMDMITFIAGSLIFAVATFAVGHSYYVEKQYEFCPNCHYQYQVYEQYDYCPECNAKLINKCDNCNKYLPDSATDTCPYCGETINTKVGEIPESKKSSDEKQQYSKCPNCEKSLKDMKDIDNCPYCGFHLTHISTNKLTECQYCHRSLDGMEHIGDKCPYCGKEIEFKVSDIPNDSN